MLEVLLPGQPEAVARLRATFAGLYSLDMVRGQPASPTTGPLGIRDPEPNVLRRLELALGWTWVSDALRKPLEPWEPLGLESTVSSHSKGGDGDGNQEKGLR